MRNRYNFVAFWINSIQLWNKIIELNWLLKKKFVIELTASIWCMTLNRQRLVESTVFSTPTSKVFAALTNWKVQPIEIDCQRRPVLFYVKHRRSTSTSSKCSWSAASTSRKVHFLCRRWSAALFFVNAILHFKSCPHHKHQWNYEIILLTSTKNGWNTQRRAQFRY